MAKHQIIYTSCMRGIDSVNDGQQIYSYNEGFNDYKSEDVKSLFTYQVPNLSPGVIMTEEVAASMPVAFMYRKLKSGKASISLNTYLGRDYMGSAGRFGNYLCHTIVTDFNDMLVYPCELFGGVSLRSHMEYQEVNNPNPPGFLPTPVIEKGNVIDLDIITDFLENGENFDYYKQMLAAMLRYPNEKKRIVICDEQENIVKWTAALHYALPLEIAKNVNFKTYEFDPELSFAQICGVINTGSRYSPASYISSDRHYVFDFINMQFSDVSSDSDIAYLDFVDTAFSFAHDSLKEFHDFVIEYTTFRDASEELYSAYYLYVLLRDGIEEIDINLFGKGIEFAEKYATNDIKMYIINKIIDETDSLSKVNNEYFLTISRYLLSMFEKLNLNQRDAVSKIVVHRIIVAVSDPTIQEGEFITLYNDIDGIARSINLSIPAELMNDETRQGLLSVMGQRVAVWKEYFIIRVINDYVKDIGLSVNELYFDKPIGELYYTIIKTVYSKSKKSGFELIEYILKAFQSNGTYLVNMILNIEGLLNDMELGEVDGNYLWNLFISLVSVMSKEEIHEINEVLAESDRFKEMFMIYSARMEKEQNLRDAKEVFKDTFEYWFNKKQKYQIGYADKVLKLYVEKIRSIPSEESFEYSREILCNAMRMRVKDTYVDQLITTVLEDIPLDKPDRENKKLLIEIQQYLSEGPSQKLNNRFLLFLVGLQFDKIINVRDVKRIINQLSVSFDSRGIDVSRVGNEELENYFKWVLSNLFKYSLNQSELTNIYKLFIMSKRTSIFFMDYCCKNIFETCQDKREWKDFAEFLKFMFDCGTEENIESTGKYLCKLSKQKLKELDEEMSALFKRNSKVSHEWNKVKNVAENTNPLLHNLSGLFKRKKY